MKKHCDQIVSKKFFILRHPATDKVTGYWVWSSEMRDSEAAIFDFRAGSGEWHWLHQYGDYFMRALPVRSGK